MAWPGWTTENVTALTRLWDAGDLSTQQIAHCLGCTKNSVIGKANRMGLKPRLDPMVWSYNGNRYRERGKR